MNTETDQNMPGLEEAAARLAELEASDTSEAAATIEQTDEQAADATLAGEGSGTVPQTQSPKKTDTQSATEEAAAAKLAADAAAKLLEDKANEGKTPEQIAADKKAADIEAGKSKYAKSQDRLGKTWDGVNKRKGELDTREQQLTQREQQLKAREEDSKRQAEQAQTQHKPEDYEQAAKRRTETATGLHQRADGLEAQAKKLEDDGKYTEAAAATAEAKALRKKAYQEEGNAEDLTKHADHLRKNPPATMEKREKELEGQRKHFTTEAAKAFPDLAKRGSELQKGVAAQLNALWQSDRTLANNPAIIFYVTRLVAAETAAACVPKLQKETVELKAKVQELEKLTTPGGPGSVQRSSTGQLPKTDEDERAELRDEAAALGSIR